MKKALLLGVALTLAPWVSVNAAARVYQSTVTSSSGHSFTECFRFNFPSPGDLSLDVLGQTMVVRSGGLDAEKGKFKAVTRKEYDATGIYAFSGVFKNERNNISGEGLSQDGETFTFSGALTTARCPSRAAPAGAASYLH